MSTCKQCGAEITFRHIDGICTPIHLHGGRRCSSYSASPREGSGFPHHLSMRELAARLGHSLLFPTICRHCSKPIWLFANPDGGFAIFNDPGKPWPRHMCVSIEATASEYVSEEPFKSQAIQRADAPTREELAESELAGLEEEGASIDLEALKQYATIFGIPLRQVWGVFSNRNRLVRTYPHNREADARAYAAQLSSERKADYYVNSLKIPMQ